MDEADTEKSLLSCDCKPSCAQLQFSIETSHSDFFYKNFFQISNILDHWGKTGDFGTDYAEQLINNTEYVNFEKKKQKKNYYFYYFRDVHWSIMSVYFKSEQFMPIERNQLYGISDLISNLGGLLGLFTGFSLITVAEIIYFLTLRIYCNKKLYGHWSGPPDEQHL